MTSSGASAAMRVAVVSCVALLGACTQVSGAVGAEPKSGKPTHCTCVNGSRLIDNGGHFTFFAEALKRTQIGELLWSPKQDVTLFVADDDTYRDVGRKYGLTWDEMLNHPALATSTLNHIVNTTVRIKALQDGTRLKTLVGEDVAVKKSASSAGRPIITLVATESKARITGTEQCNCDSCNIILYTLDNVLATEHAKSQDLSLINQIQRTLVEPLIQSARKLRRAGKANCE